MAIKRGVSILLAGALMSGGAAAYLTDGYIENQVKSHKADLEKEFEPIKVIVPRHDLRVGEQVNYNNVATRSIPKKFLHADSIRPEEVDSIVGHQLVHPVNGGESLLLSHLAKKRGAFFSSLIDNGKRALTFPVDVISSMSGLLRPGDRIDLLATLRDADDTLTHPMLRDVNVMATGGVVDEATEEGGPGRFQTITLLVDPKEAAKIIHAQQVGTLTVTLRSPDDKQTIDDAPVTVDTLLGRPKKKKATRRATTPVEIIIGGAVK